MKKTILLTMTIAAALAARASAAAFSLDGFRAADIPAGNYALTASAPKAEGDDLIGVDLTVRVPFKALKKGVEHMAAGVSGLTIIDPAAPVFTKSGEFLKISNIRVDVNGIVVTPVLTAKLYLENKDHVAVRIQKVQVHASLAPDAGTSPDFKPVGDSRAQGDTSGTELNQEEIMVMVSNVLIQSAYDAINEDLKEKKIPLKAQQVINMKYNPKDWTIRATVSAKIVDYFIPVGIVGEFHLTGVSMGPTGLVLNVQTAQ
ncbi:MAG: hypothetical protein NTY45_16210 [Elusimicrobia bacterium]|nr:hypothetical protein [Elusimicrobiota bacterium]